ncbi:MAG: hypothetical protein KDB27_13515 [Planctomycetales bacterium]|nr:hypothetical protein [Planctomycetales bacterium]
MGKEINLSEEIGEITAGAEALANATKRIEENRTKKSAPQKLTVVDKNKGSDESPRTRQIRNDDAKNPKKSAVPVLDADSDPWVTMSTKIRLSKKRKLHRLSVLRELNGLRPSTKMEFIDQALDVVFDRFNLPKANS